MLHSKRAIHSSRVIIACLTVYSCERNHKLRCLQEPYCQRHNSL
ncbi:unnamed protein product [Moneuplotes crassus]|uniref:Uncharacterized protein n=1 Tax=Euplotes crassus TaxID=5936 RepID=A0AAD1XVU0_EUPCR|nr:unnamed protein product [Moneuplotes crassus]